MKVLVTGANGFVGRHLVALLHAQRHEVHAAAGPEVSGGADIRSLQSVTALMAEAQPDAVVHLAGFSSVAQSHQRPSDAFAVTALGTLNLLEAARQKAPKSRVLVVSSGEVYGKVSFEARATEDSELAPTSPYGAAKVSAEVCARQYHHGYGLHTVVARPFNHLGPGQDPGFFLPSFAQQVARGEPVISVGDLTPVRDFSHVHDVVRAYLLLLESGLPGETYNVCSGDHATIREVLDLLIDTAGSTAEVKVDPARMRPVEIPWLVGSSKKLEALGWRREKTWKDAAREVLAEAKART